MATGTTDNLSVKQEKYKKDEEEWGQLPALWDGATDLYCYPVKKTTNKC